jgi:chemotaxis protein methyltransferase CheR
LSGNVELSDRVYYRFVDLVYREAGISLGDARRELVRTRLLKRLSALNLSSFDEYYERVSRQDPDGEELVAMLDAISTNKTDFFRENQHFRFMADTVLPALTGRIAGGGPRRIRIWSAGCSSGEEPYTLAMVLRERIATGVAWDAKILATDISTKVLHAAYVGLYEESKVAPVPPKMRLASFTREETDQGAFYRIKPELRKMVAFRRLNLMNGTYPFTGKFDVIFCRNVMIYFDRPTQESLANRLHQYLHPGGYLFIGHSESLNSLTTPFQFVQPTIYLKPK